MSNLREETSGHFQSGSFHPRAPSGLLQSETILGSSTAPASNGELTSPSLNQLIFRWWRISLRNEYRSTKPGEAKETHEDFLENSHLQVQIALIFGAGILDYVFNLCQGKFDFLERLSDALLLSIISYLDLEDLARLAQTSRRFAKLCASDQLWERMVKSACGTITPDMKSLADKVGWRQMFFANKFQFLRQLHKQKQRQSTQGEKQV